jgi:predicted DNA-binding antitoxin AbrB/MazE fold protein
MTVSIEAVYENGVLRLKAPLSIPDGEHVDLIVMTRGTEPTASRASEILAGLAALPMEGPAEGFNGRDHDRVLYGAKDKP